MEFKLRTYKEIFRYVLLMSIVYCLMSYIILSKLNQTENNMHKQSKIPSKPILVQAEHPNFVSRTGSIKVQQNVQLKSETNDQHGVLSSSSFESNSTHLWSMPLANEISFRLSKLLPCRIVEYEVGRSSRDQINSCNHSPKQEFSIERTLDAQKWIYHHQNPSNCANQQFAIIDNIYKSSFPSSMEFITSAFAKALAEDRIALYATPTNWPYGDCKLNNPDCIFLPISNCSIPSLIDNKRTIRINAQTNQFPLSLPMIFRQRSLIWYRSQLMFYLLRYNQQTFSYVQSQIAQSFHPPSIEAHTPFIALSFPVSENVKRPKRFKRREVSNPFLLNQYFHLFHTDSIKGNITTIYFSSQEKSIYTEFTKLNENLSNHYKLLTITTTNKFGYNLIPSSAKETRTLILQNILTDLYIQAHADLHVGSLASSSCRLVDAIRLALGKTIPFYTSDNLYLINDPKE